MAPPAASRSVTTSTLTVALLGNPNTGKSTLFSALAGIHQRVGNYPGVTVEKKTGRFRFAGRELELIDLPGLYSLAPRSRDEMVAVDVLLGRSPGTAPVDVVVCILDASHLERHLYLLSQILEVGLPTVVVVNMLDVAESQGLQLNLELLRERLGAPVVATQGHRRIGITDLKAAITRATQLAGHASRPSPLPPEVSAEVTRLEDVLASKGRQLPRFLVQRLLIDADGYVEQVHLGERDGELRDELRQSRARLSQAGLAVPAVETTARYDWVERTLEGVVLRHGPRPVTGTDRIDRILTHRFWGTAIFAAVMVVVFQAVFSWAEPLMGFIETVFAHLGGWVEAHMAEGALRSLLVEGVIAGVGGVLVFLPQILILFLFIAIMEDSGYMARAAYLMDRLMARIGLSGKSFVPMLSSFACAIPGIMAARVIENERDRLTTILVAPLLTCSARLPVYALLIAAFIPDRRYLGGLLNLQGLTLLALYVLGIGAAIVAAMIFKRTLFRGETPPFVMELPSYKWPSPRTALLRMIERAVVFVRTAGTLILAVSVLVWAALYFPQSSDATAPLRMQRDRLESQLGRLPPGDPHQDELDARLARVETQLHAQQQRHSFLGRTGRVIEPVVRPLGWDWRIGCAVLASFPAREVVVSTMSVIFSQGEAYEVESAQGVSRFGERLRAVTWEGSERPLFTVPVALSIMVFFALCAQCAATLATIRRETNSWRWPVFTFTYMTALAYLAALLTYQIGVRLIG